MADYGRAVEFGIFPTPDAAALPELFAMVAAAERGGLDLVGVQDHPYQRRFVDSFVLMGSILERTTRIRVFPDVANVPLRTPAMIAKAGASLDLLSGGRFELGLGAGAFWPAIAALGTPAREPAEAARALCEAVDIVRLLWSPEPSVGYSGQHYRLAGTKPGPQPAHDIGIWLGVGGPRMLEFTGRSADGWVPSASYFPPTALPEMHARIDAGALAAGRDPAAIKRLYNIGGAITDGSSDGDFHWPADRWVEELTALVVDVGMDTVIFAPARDTVRQVERFAAEIVPGVREAVGRERAARARGTASS
ncbi:luciferase-like monooxygenase [Microterricola gilva]|uniref:Luciferase-like monooxygenase n=1 Tax=Microterricola gilva TaxID=393267 RepID=A0A4Q8ALX8_9MICO|nr:LLM class flavin-dependent oxidoreductase [Microterricola gilva]RZU65590.1 luciferase-like monooxygenase [Microterricola gilva]